MAKKLKKFGEGNKSIVINGFANGGRVPIPVNNPNDPRLRAYNDSNQTYNNFLEDVNYVKKQGAKFTGINPAVGGMMYKNPDYGTTIIDPKKKPVQPYVYEKPSNGVKQQPITKKPTYQEFLKTVNPDFVGNDYNLEEAYNKLPLKQTQAWAKDPNKNHLPDTYKLPNHKTFSNESKYYKEGMKAVKWEGDKAIPINQEQQFQPDMVQLNNTPNYDKTKLYQGYDFIQQTGLRPGDYTETQVQEAMKNKGLPKKSLGGRVLPKFGKGSTYRGGGDSLPVPPGTPPSKFEKNVETGAGIAASAVPMLTSFIPDDKVTDSEGNEVGSKESMGKGILNGAAQGASIGAAAGPWGMAIGAGVGAIYGGVTNSMNNADVDRAQQQANMRIQNKNISNSVLTNKSMFSTNVNNNDQMIAAKGGTVVNEDMGNPNAELELNETFRDPMTGETGMVDGPSHDNGGIEMSLAEGTQIWSDRLKHNGRTFASLTKPIINKIATLEKGTEDNPNSRFKQNSIKLLNSQLDFFFNVQESNKQQDEMKRTLKKQEGGVVDDMGNYHYANGGIYIKPENRGKFTAYKERTGKTTEEALHSPNAHVRQMANFAKNAAGWKHAEGGYVLPKFAGAGTFGDPEIEPVVPEEVPYVNDFNAKSRRDFLLKNNPTQFANSLKQARLEGNNQAMYGNSWNNKGYTLGANGAAGDQYTFDKIGKPTYQETEAQPQNNSGFRRNNTGELIQAGALAGSAFTQLNNINRLAAPGIRPDVRLTGAIPNPRYVDLAAERGAINRSAMNAMGEAQRGFGNSATAQAFKNKARINQLEGAGKSYLNQENINADIYNKFAGMRGDAAMKEAMANNEIANANIENKYKFNESRVANRNAVIGDIGKGVSDIGRNRTNYSNQLEMANIYGNAREGTVQNQMLGDTESAKAMFNAGTPEQKKTWNAERTKRNLPPFKYGGMVKTRSLKGKY